MNRLKFSSDQKLLKQMQTRGWTRQQIYEAPETTPIPATGKNGPALRYRHPVSGKSVIVDAATGEIFHLGEERYLYD